MRKITNYNGNFAMLISYCYKFKFLYTIGIYLNLNYSVYFVNLCVLKPIRSLHFFKALPEKGEIMGPAEITLPSWLFMT